MSKPAVYYWAPSTGAGYQDGIALIQSSPMGTPLNLVANTPYGTFSYINMLNPNTTNNDISTDIIRSVSIKSGATSNSGVTFVISGIGTPVDGNGNPTQVVGPISENLPGAGAGSISNSTNIYTIIYSITPTVANAVDVSVGYGPKGITDYYELDCNRTSIQGYSSTYSVQVIPSPALTLGNTVYVSLNKTQSYNNYGSVNPFGLINGNQVAFIPAYSYFSDLPPTDVSYFDYLYTGFQLVWINITDTGSDSLFFTIMQQGI